MTVGEICSRDVVCALRGDTVRHAAKLMREHHVGALVVTEDRDEIRVPIGMVTDRDIVVAVVATGLDSELLTVDDIMCVDMVVAGDKESEADAAETMCVKGIRRLPVVDAAGALIGIVTADDLLDSLAEEMTSLSKMLSRERRRESQMRV